MSTQTDFTLEGSTDPFVEEVCKSVTNFYVNSNGLRYPIKRQFLPQSVVNENCSSQVDSNLCHIARIVIEMTNKVYF